MFKLFSNYNERQIKRLRKIVKKINQINYSQLSDEEIQQQTKSFMEQFQNGKTLNDILPEAFALVKEASKRVLLKTHYDVQLMGGIVLHEGKVSEMKTGEGKTLVGTLSAYLNALGGNSIHIVTVNEYLARRDYEELSPLFSYLGITSSYIHSEMSYDEKKEAYKASIIFGTNNEFGFDYLRDNMVRSYEDKVQGSLDFAIIDEVDSILIDESRTPLVISGPSSETSDLLLNTDALVKMMKKGVHFEVDEETQQVYLTEEGITKTEQFFHIDNLYAPDKSRLTHFLNQSLKANVIMKKDKDYIISNGEVHIIDEFTGRLSKGRRFSNNLHQAIEVKEKVKMQEETTTKATITYQNYFRLYKKISGMTGTAETEKEELKQVYKMNTIVIPTNRPIMRKDNDDLIFPTKQEKIESIAKKVLELHAKGQPVLVGTTTIQESEEMSHAFSKVNIPHVVLNAKNHEKEADIISNAGQRESVTIATNMAGRGTDIKLGEGVQQLGGLFVLGTSKNENRRVDNQLRGRSGRQGDPGESQFFVSLEDELMIRFGADKAKAMMERFNLYEEGGISSSILTKLFANAQKQLEGSNYEVRKRLLKYDDILSLQRKLIYQERTNLLQKKEVKETLLDLIEKSINNTINSIITDANVPEEWDFNHIHQSLQSLLNQEFEMPDSNQIDTKEELVDFYKNISMNRFNEVENSVPSDVLNDISRNIMVGALDKLWERHLDQLDDIRQGIHLYAYSQTDPFREYQIRAKEAFDNMLIQFSYDVAATFYGIKITFEENN
ncbi:preprotein translocase subunit SecA [Bacillus cereus]|uniref:preprotein translocase subunit SecA n=1 Tax=Bacillus cereus TaxID=1396 RepID=UPI000BFCE414|nr:preprotein translocase subunit SecA [Bacillus cereus]PGP14733.1 preprotein translocase subunit SecA [Bacillus cereus]